MIRVPIRPVSARPLLHERHLLICATLATDRVVCTAIPAKEVRT
ncbi:MAG TPA: hypothetical protein PK710_10990 [Polyangiaceae bacterium]|nr:hypothetical protein [Polyangiaceae bacterium]